MKRREGFPTEEHVVKHEQPSSLGLDRLDLPPLPSADEILQQVERGVLPEVSPEQFDEGAKNIAQLFNVALEGLARWRLMRSAQSPNGELLPEDKQALVKALDITLRGTDTSNVHQQAVDQIIQGINMMLADGIHASERAVKRAKEANAQSTIEAQPTLQQAIKQVQDARKDIINQVQQQNEIQLELGTPTIDPTLLLALGHIEANGTIEPLSHDEFFEGHDRVNLTVVDGKLRVVWYIKEGDREEDYLMNNIQEFGTDVQVDLRQAVEQQLEADKTTHWLKTLEIRNPELHKQAVQVKEAREKLVEAFKKSKGTLVFSSGEALPSEFRNAFMQLHDNTYKNWLERHIQTGDMIVIKEDYSSRGPLMLKVMLVPSHDTPKDPEQRQTYFARERTSRGDQFRKTYIEENIAPF